MLSPFGKELERLLKARKVSKRALARVTGIGNTRLTESLRDRRQAKEGGKRAYAPDLDLVPAIAEHLHLTAAEREHLLALARAEHSDEVLVKDYQRRIRDLTSALQRLRMLEDIIATPDDASDDQDRAAVAALPAGEVIERLVLTRRANRKLLNRLEIGRAHV